MKRKKRKRSRKILLFLSDTHSGHRLGLLNPNTMLEREDEDGNIEQYSPELTHSQKYLWKVYKWGIDEVSALADGDPVYIWHNGDLTAGSSRGKFSASLVSTRDGDQYIMAFSNLLPLMSIPNVSALRLIYGTGWHVFGGGSSESVIAGMLRERYPKMYIRSMYHNLIDVGGKWVDVSHHGPGQSKRVWLEGNIARFYLRDLVIKALANNDIVPDLVIRSHIHTYVSEPIDIHGVQSRIVVTPSLCFVTDYARKTMRSLSRIDNGMVAFTVEDGVLSEPIKLMKRKDFRTREVI